MLTENQAQTQFLITAENVLTDKGYFTEAGLMENIAQTAAAHAGLFGRQLLINHSRSVILVQLRTSKYSLYPKLVTN